MAIQVIPEGTNGIDYTLIDEAIKVISGSGFRYRVCPFETVVECSLDDALVLINNIHNSMEEAGVRHMLTNLKIQIDYTRKVTIDDKMAKYKR
jgi:uncharacterized protein YqgV (UPF0045/DUF77 family)